MGRRDWGDGEIGWQGVVKGFCFARVPLTGVGAPRAARTAVVTTR